MATITKKITDQMVRLLRQGCSISAACDAVAISRQTFYNWMRNPKQKKFQQRIQNARAYAHHVATKRFLELSLKCETREIRINYPVRGKKGGGWEKIPGAVASATETTKITSRPDLILEWLKRQHPEDWGDASKISLSLDEEIENLLQQAKNNKAKPQQDNGDLEEWEK